MANVTENLLVKGARGNVARQFVYKRHGHDTHIAKMPRIKKNLQPTEDQKEVRGLFASAALYAQGAISSPALKEQYEKKTTPGKTAYNIAFRDYLKAPVVQKIITDNYNGTAGSKITVAAKDDFRVVKVKVSIKKADGTLLEEGEAVLNPVNMEQWVYTTTQVNNVLTGTVITAIAADLPGNTATLSKTL